MDHDENYLAHHGILGQKWGVRRYQNYDGSLTSLGRKHRGLNEKGSKSAGDGVKKAVKTIQKAQQKRRAERTTAMQTARKASYKKNAEDKVARESYERDKLKQRIRSHPKELYKYRDVLSKDEAKELIEQIEWDRKLEDIKFDEYKRFNARAREVANTAQNVASLMTQSISIYNNAALIYNAMIDHQIKSGGMSMEDGRKARIDQLAWKNDQNNSGNQNGNNGNQNSDAEKKKK